MTPLKPTNERGIRSTCVNLILPMPSFLGKILLDTIATGRFVSCWTIRTFRWPTNSQTLRNRRCFNSSLTSDSILFLKARKHLRNLSISNIYRPWQSLSIHTPSRANSTSHPKALFLSFRSLVNARECWSSNQHNQLPKPQLVWDLSMPPALCRVWSNWLKMLFAGQLQEGNFKSKSCPGLFAISTYPGISHD